MAEVAEVRGTNGLTVVSTFSGCGGSCLGFEMAGYSVRWASEFIPEAQRTYRLNHPDTYLDTRDIRQVTASEILERAELGVGELDVLEGSPPCASFSTAGARSRLWGQVKKYSDSKQRVDDLFGEYLRLLAGLRPRAFVAENVAGLVKGNAWGHFEGIMETARSHGYNVAARLLDAQWLGVPQMRERLIFVGVRADLERAPVHPEPLPYRYSIRDAVPDIDQREPTRFARLHEGPRDVSKMAIGARWRRLGIGENSDEVFTIWRPDPSLPSPTILATCANDGAGSVLHPFLPRKFTTFELRRLCAFPDDFQLTGHYVQKGERLGRSVPPLMMWRVARALRDDVFAQLGRVRADAREVQL